MSTTLRRSSVRASTYSSQRTHGEDDNKNRPSYRSVNLYVRVRNRYSALAHYILSIPYSNSKYIRIRMHYGQTKAK